MVRVEKIESVNKLTQYSILYEPISGSRLLFAGKTEDYDKTRCVYGKDLNNNLTRIPEDMLLKDWRILHIS